ncbi:hypothetical protein [Nostoc sp.]
MDAINCRSDRDRFGKNQYLRNHFLGGRSNPRLKAWDLGCGQA